MKNGFLILILLVVVQSGRAQDFVNLDFEDATIAPTPVGGSVFPADPTQCFPGWTVSGAGTVVMYNDLSLGSPALELMGPNFPNAVNRTPLQGLFSTELYYDNGTIFQPPTLSQTGLVPAGTQSINFSVGNGLSDAAVSLNGVNISLAPIAGGRLAGDISAFAGSMATLTFSVALNRVGDNALYFDDIQFSTSPIPEPSTLALGALGALLLGFRRWRKF
jgi:hypothetical protein